MLPYFFVLYMKWDQLYIWWVQYNFQRNVWDLNPSIKWDQLLYNFNTVIFIIDKIFIDNILQLII